MTLREVLCQALNTGARGEGGCSTPSITRGNEIRPTPGAMHATDSLTRKTDGVSLVHDRQRHTRRGNPPRQQEPHMTQPAPQHPTQRHTRQHAPRPPHKPDRAHRKLRGQGLSDLPPQSEPAERRRKANTKPARSQQKLARRQISRSALRRASRPRSRSR